MTIRLDKMDLKILEALQEDARLTNQKLAADQRFVLHGRHDQSCYPCDEHNINPFYFPKYKLGSHKAI